MAIEKSTGFMGNVERSIQIGKAECVSKVTAEKPIKVGERDGVTYYKSSVIVAIDARENILFRQIFLIPCLIE